MFKKCKGKVPKLKGCVYAVLSNYSQGGVYDYPEDSMDQLIDIVGSEGEARERIEHLALEDFYFSHAYMVDEEEWTNELNAITRIQHKYGGYIETTWYYKLYVVQIEAG